MNPLPAGAAKLSSAFAGLVHTLLPRLPREDQLELEVKVIPAAAAWVS